jgi:hexosaminidase
MRARIGVRLVGLVGCAAAVVAMVPAASAAPAMHGRESRRPAGAPLTIPALQRWHAGTGFWRLATSPTIDVRRDQPAAVRSAAVLADDLSKVLDQQVRVVTDVAPSVGDIVMRSIAKDRRLGREGYRLTIGSSFVIAARTPAGLFYGGRSLLQLLHAGRSVQRGIAVDWPRYQERGLMVDAARTTYSTAWVLREIGRLAALKLNVLHLHLTDDQRWAITSRAFPGVVGKHPFTRSDLHRILRLARRDHVTVVPEIEMPGHMAAFLAHHLSLILEPAGAVTPSTSGTYTTDKLDITRPAALRAVRRMLDEYLPLFPGRFWDMGADEYLSPAEYALFPQLATYAIRKYGVGATPADAIHGFINWVDRIVRAHGKTLRLWSDQVGGLGKVPVNRDVVLEWWDSFSPFGDTLTVSPQTLLDRGYRVVNAGWYPNYYTSDIGPVSGKASLPGVYSAWQVNQFDATEIGNTVTSKQTVAPHSPGLLGSQLNIWGPLDETTEQTAKWVEPHLAVLAQKTWDSALPASSYAGFTSDLRRVGLP